MHTQLCFKNPHILSEHCFLRNPFPKTNSSHQSIIYAPKSPCFGSWISLSRRAQNQKSTILCARKNGGRIGSAGSSKLMLELASSIALNLGILPPMLDPLIREFSRLHRNRGDLVIWNGLGEAVFDGRRRKRKRKLLWPVFIASCGLGLMSGKILAKEAFLRSLGFCLLGIGLTPCLGKRAMRCCIVAIFLGSLMLSCGFRKEGLHLQNWVERVRVSSPVMQIVKGTRTRTRKWF